MGSGIQRTKANEISVCTGPGCRAWDAENILGRLLEQRSFLESDRAFRVCRVSCMNSCGGGASIKLSCKKTIVKLRKSGDVNSGFFKEWAQDQIFQRAVSSTD